MANATHRAQSIVITQNAPHSDGKCPDNSQSHEDALIKQLREEATNVKNCFTTFSFQAIALDAIILGFIFRYFETNELIVFTSSPLISLLMAVTRIGTYKVSV